MRMNRMRTRTRGGFTLIEAVLAILIMGITGAALFGTLASTKMLQEDMRQVNALNRVATEFVETLRELSYLSLHQALPDGEYRFSDFQYYQGGDGEIHQLVGSTVLYGMYDTCQQFRVDESIRVTSTADRIKVSIRFTSQEDPEDIPVQIVTEISENGMNFK